MDETTKIVFPDTISGMTPSDVMSMVNNNGGFGGNNSWIWLFFLFLLFGNGYGGYSGNSATGSNLLMQAIQGNKDAITSLSSMLNTDINSIQSALSSISTAIQSTAAASQLSNCQQTNTLQSAINNVGTTVERGFSNSNYEAAARTCDLKNALKDAEQTSTNSILSKLDAMENSAMQDKITSLTAQNNALTTQINLNAQNAAFAQMLAPIQAEVAAIKASQPSTTTVQYPNLTAVPSYLANSVYGLNYTNSIWS